MSIACFKLDDNGAPVGKLDFRQRLAIALGAAKGKRRLIPPVMFWDSFEISALNYLSV